MTEQRSALEDPRNVIGIRRGVSGCMKCGDTWNWKKSHVLELDEDRGIFPCCKDCWKKMNPEEKLSCCRQLFIGWRIKDPSVDVEMLTKQAKAAIEAEINV